jgi:hypothetical protein
MVFCRVCGNIHFSTGAKLVESYYSIHLLSPSTPLVHSIMGTQSPSLRRLTGKMDQVSTASPHTPNNSQWGEGQRFVGYVLDLLSKGVNSIVNFRGETKEEPRSVNETAALKCIDPIISP